MGVGAWGRAGIAAVLALAGCGGPADGRFSPVFQGVDAQVGFDAGGGPAPIDATVGQPADAATGGSADAGVGPRADGSADGGGRGAGAGVSLPRVCPGPHAPGPASVDDVGGCGATLPASGDLRVAPMFDGQSFPRCGTVGDETAWQVTLSPDASRLAALTSAGTVRLFSTRDWHEIAQLAAPVGQLDAATFSPDGSTLATVSREMAALLLWRARDGQLFRQVAIPARTTLGDPESTLAYASDGLRLATKDDAMLDFTTGALTDWTTGMPVLPPAGPSPDLSATDHHGDALVVDGFRFVGCDSRLLTWGRYSAGNAGLAWGVELTDPVTGKTTQLDGGLYSQVDGVAVSPDGRWVALAEHGEQWGDVPGVALFDATSGALFASDPAEPGQVVGFSPDGTSLYLATSTTIVARAIPTLAIERRLPLATGETLAGVSPQGLLIVSRPGISRWLDPATGQPVRREPFSITAPSFSADGRYGVSSGGDGALFHLWRETSPTELCAPAAPPRNAHQLTMALSPDGRTLGLFRWDGVVDLRPVAGDGSIGARAASVATGLGVVYEAKLAVANGGQRFAVIGGEPNVAPSVAPTLAVFDVQSGQSLFTHAVYPGNGQAMALSPDGRRLAFLEGTYGRLQVAAVAVDGGASLLTLPPTSSPPGIDSFSPDGTRLALAASDGMEIWRLSDGQREVTEGTGATYVGPSALSPNWALLAEEVSSPASATSEGLQIWNPTASAPAVEIDGVSPLSAPPRIDDAGTIAVTTEFLGHDYATDWWVPTLWDLQTGTKRRIFLSGDGEPPGGLPFAGGSRLLTQLGSALAVWCR